MKFYRCNRCGNIIAYIKSSGVKVVCCGQTMEELLLNTTEASQEKHKPTYTISNNEVNVTVSTTLHPMTEEHYIQWIVLETDKGYSIKYLKPNDKPTATFIITKDEKIKNVYSYCNLHGLWSNI